MSGFDVDWSKVVIVPGMPPESVQIGPRRYEVLFDLEELHRVEHDDGQDLYGQSDHAKLRILVDPSLPHDQRADTLLHEVLHGLTELTGIADDLGPKREERVVGRLTPALLDLLRRNPQLDGEP